MENCGIRTGLSSTRPKKTDKKVGAKESLVDVGDQVLMKNLLPQNKLSTKFLTTPATVVDRVGNSVTLKTSEGQLYKRNTSHIRPFVASPNVETMTEVPANITESNSTAHEAKDEERPSREKRRPKRFEDYLL